jgi:membrane protein DedA with SNARE-associated domain
MTQTQARPEAPVATDTTTTTTSSTGRTLTYVAFACAGIAVFFLPPLFGIAGIICAAIAMSKRDALAKWALTASIAGMVVGMVLGYVVFSSR